MDYNITPRIGIGPIKLGMSRDQVRRILGTFVSEIDRRPYADCITDSFDSVGLQVDYDKADICNLITTFAEAILDGKTIIGMPFNECEQWLRQLDPHLEIGDTGAISRLLGVSVYISSVKKYPTGAIEAVHVFVEGYYQ